MNTDTHLGIKRTKNGKYVIKHNQFILTLKMYLRDNWLDKGKMITIIRRGEVDDDREQRGKVV